jgi:hypothetical protein
MAIRVGIAALGLLAACDGADVDALGDVCTIAGPDRVELNFGVVAPGRTARRGVELRNTSASADCVLGPTRFEMLEGDGFFDPSTEPPVEPTQAVLAPQSALVLSFGFRPRGLGPSRARYLIETSDPRRPTQAVELVGSASEAATLVLVPNDLIFGDVAATCETETKTVTIFNTGGAPATVARWMVDGTDGAFNLVDAPMLPAALQPGASLAVEVEFAPDAAGVAEGRLTIDVDVNGQPRTSTLALSGNAIVEEPLQTDPFERPARQEHRILFLVDARPSMTDEHQALSVAFERLLEVLGAADYRIAIMGTDAEEGRFFPLDGRAAARVVTPESTPSPLEALRANLARLQSRDHVNAPLAAAYAALTPPNLTGPNAGFLGSRGRVTLVALTDRADASAETPDFYADFIASLRAGLGAAPQFWAVTAGVDGCPADGTIPNPPPRLAVVANRTGGRTWSICHLDWTEGLFQGGIRPTTPRPRMFLTNQPIEGTIEVFVDGVRVAATGPDGQLRWRYAFATNEVQFVDAHMPPPGARVQVTYAAACL